MHLLTHNLWTQLSRDVHSKINRQLFHFKAFHTWHMQITFHDFIDNRGEYAGWRGWGRVRGVFQDSPLKILLALIKKPLDITTLIVIIFYRIPLFWSMPTEKHQPNIVTMKSSFLLGQSTVSYNMYTWLVVHCLTSGQMYTWKPIHTTESIAWFYYKHINKIFKKTR